MDKPDVIFANPWLKKTEKTTSLPDDARFACSFEQNFIIDLFDVTAFFHRTETTDELWMAAGVYIPTDFERAKLSDVGCVFAVQRKGDELTACLRLLDMFFRAKHGFEWPERFLVAGIIDELAFINLVKRIENELEENRQKARKAETEIVGVARELELFPKPTGDSPKRWFARCPESNHMLYIDAPQNLFFCGWCKRSGAIEELRAFVKERKDRRINSTSGRS